MKAKLILLIQLLFVVNIYSQELSLKIKSYDDNIKIDNFEDVRINRKYRIEAVLENTTAKPIIFFNGFFETYGGFRMDWLFDINNKKSEGKKYGLDTNVGYKEKNFVKINPGESTIISQQIITIDTMGLHKYKIYYKQNPNTIKPKYAKNKKARNLGKSITPLNLSAVLEFTVAPPVKKAFKKIELSDEELAKAPEWKDLYDARHDPANVFKLDYSGYDKSLEEIKADLDTIKQFKNLKELTLQLYEGVITIPNDFAKFKLNSIYLTGKQSAELIVPNNLFASQDLKKIYISSVNIRGIDNMKVGSNINKISLQSIKTGFPKWMFSLKNLSDIYIQGINTNEIPAGFENLINLKKLIINKTNITELKHIGKCTKIEYLNLNSNKITTINNDIKNLDLLRELTIQGNKITEVPSGVFYMDELQKLFLQKNNINAISNDINKACILKEINLNDNKLTKLPPNLFKIKTLKELRVSDNNLNSLPVTIGMAQNLVILYLDDNNIKVIPSGFKNLYKLKTVMISGLPLLDRSKDLVNEVYNRNRKI